MFRPLFATSLLALAAPAFAEQFVAEALVDTVTIYPGQAGVTRLVPLDLPAGRHEILVPGLPLNLDAQGLRLAAPEGVLIGAVTLSRDRLPVTPDLDSPEVEAARAEIERLEDAIRAKTAEIEEILLEAEAAEAQIAFLQALAANGGGDGRSLDDLREMALMAGGEILRLKREAFAARQRAEEKMREREELQEELEEARQALDALVAPDAQGSVLSFAVTAEAAASVTVEVTTIEGYAGWQPAYDMRLDTEAETLTVDRSVVVGQNTGSDWRDVQLILSTARPGEQTAPSEVYPQPRRIVDEDELPRYGSARDGKATLEMAEAEPMAPPMADMARDEAAMTASVDVSGVAVQYIYPGRVTIRDGVEDLRLPLDTLGFGVEVWAEAVPARDANAFRVAEVTNDSEELLLPGQALLFADGTMVGFSWLPLLAAGADVELGFGPLDGLRLEKRVPDRTEGEAGVFLRGNQWRETAELEIENLTGQDWQVLLRDAVPYSEQDDLVVTVEADPAIDRRDPDGRRGIVEWDLDVGAGETRVVTVETRMTWPSGMALLPFYGQPF